MSHFLLLILVEIGFLAYFNLVETTRSYKLVDWSSIHPNETLSLRETPPILLAIIRPSTLETVTQESATHFEGCHRLIFAYCSTIHCLPTGVENQTRHRR
ncbi:hypothetical protein CEXT_26971 [Caerostris extrusa]|uniref:Secreted protein n=1 Tax=Caerostris extrusa TaxID=172846 RepID=A0AAV4XGC3_CAEEX|nr:hypothetical protein CEXT_26971 [Caerostris extrusa]